MGTVEDLRQGRTAHPVLAAAVSAFVPVTLAAWLAWQVLEGDQRTLLRSQFQTWLLVTLGAAVLTGVLAGLFWRAGAARAGAVVGVLASGPAVLLGLLADLVGSGGLA